MEIFLKIVLLIFCFIMMEGVAWFTHKYIMHGFLWVLHKSHHEPGYRVVEGNDAFGVFFAAFSFILIFSGLPHFGYSFFAGIGIALYGVAYFFVHDIMVHQRFPLLKNVKHPYLRAIRRAHKIHHKKMGKEDGEAFGFLFVKNKYYPDNKKQAT
ncbi:MAG: beta-carotene hydroxylase [Chitinophagaceae bacterium]|nr:MAG: beta-carotene hydroxylase [Chitinophagaceae bacterium]